MCIVLYIVRVGTTKEDSLVTFLNKLMERRGILPSRLAFYLDLSHVTLSRWLSQKDTPSPRSCQKIAEFSGVPLMRILSLAGHLPSSPDLSSAKWPEFREYAKGKYARELDDDVIRMIEDLIDRRRKRRAEAGETETDSIDPS